MNEKIIIFDFDGTLTKRKIPFYPGIFKTCLSSKTSLLKALSVLSNNAKNFDSDFYLNYYNFLFEVFNTFGNEENNLFYGSDKVDFNPGVISFFKSMNRNKNVKKYILTSGLEEYVKKTKISPYVNGIYGTRYRIENGVLTPTFILTGERKPEVIKEIIGNKDCDSVYVGDGLTDVSAFSYVKAHGGKTVLVGSRKKDARETKEVVDYYFDADFTKESKLYKYLRG